MGLLDRTKLAVDIAKVVAEIYGIVSEKGRRSAEREARIKALETELEELRKRVP
jgi:sulfite reductase beta subunit-like hemoprotein